MRTGMKRLWMGLVSLLVLSGAAPAALACQAVEEPAGPVVVRIRLGSLQVPWMVRLSWPSLRTRAAPAGTICAVGLRAGALQGAVGLETFSGETGLPFERFGGWSLDARASAVAREQLGGTWFVFTAVLPTALPAGEALKDVFQAVAPAGTTFAAISAAYAAGPVLLTGYVDPLTGALQRVQTVAGVTLLAGTARPQPDEALLARACDPAEHPNVRRAAAAVVSARWLQDPPPPAELFRYSGDPTRPAACRRLGFEAQVSALFTTGDPLLGEPLSEASAQAYADAVARAPTPERAYVLATGLARFLREGFAIVPGGVGESYRRLQTCLAGEIHTSEDDRVLGVRLDCAQEAMRRAVGDTIATSFFVAFRDNPFVNVGCDDLRAQAEDLSTTVAARWAAAKALVFDARCTPNTVEALSDLALRATSLELKQAIVRPLAELLAIGDLEPEILLFNATSAASAPLRQAYAWAAGIVLSSREELWVDPECAPISRSTGPLEAWAAISINGLSEPAQAAIAPLARAFASALVEVNRGLSCELERLPLELRLIVELAVPGARLPLESSLLL